MAKTPKPGVTKQGPKSRPSSNKGQYTPGKNKFAMEIPPKTGDGKKKSS